jgi:Ser/Thr protein kinase RdoA (MazF antagonist)
MQHIYGRLLARLHHDLELFPAEGQRPGAGKVWELDTWVAPANSGSFNDLLAAFGREHAELELLIRRYRYRNLRELARLGYPDLPDRPIHGDFDASNMLWHDGQLAAVLDFDWCRRDALACDLAAALPWDQMTAGRIRALLEGYEEVRTLDEREWALLPALTRAHLLFFIAFRLVEWKLLGAERAAYSIARTVRDRLPRTEGLERYLASLRTAGSAHRA